MIVNLILNVILVVNVIFIVSVIFFQRKNPTQTIAWVLILAFLPVIGFIFYIAIGNTASFKVKKIRRLKMKNDIEYKERLLRQLKFIKDQKIVFNDPEMDKHVDMILMNIRNSASLLTQNNNVEIYTEARLFYDAIMEDIKNAVSSIHMLFYSFSDTAITHKILELLEIKAREGVEVRLIYDKAGSMHTPGVVFKKLTDAGGKVYPFLPDILSNLIRFNFRNHRKIAVIDGKVAYTGGMNIGDEYMGLNPKITPWRDTQIKITGSAVYMLQIRFILDWIYIDPREYEAFKDASFGGRYFPDQSKNGSVSIQIVSNGPDIFSEKIKYSYLKLMNEAEKTLFIQTPYFIPDEAFLETLKLAAMSGVDVRLMIPGVPDRKFIYRITLSNIKELLDYGIKVYKHQGFMHAKTMTADSKLLSVGTANMDIRSFFLDFEVNTFIYDAGVAKQYNDIFLRDIENCRELTRDDFKIGIFEKMFRAVLRIFSPLV